MRVGAILLFFGWPPSSSSLSLTSRFKPEGTAAVFRGVSGGVVMGTPVTLAEFVAVRPGTCPTIKDGLVMIPACDGCVTIDEVEFDRAGDDGRWLTKEAEVAAGGEGAVSELPESRCRWCDPFGKGEGGANTDVGVGIGVFWFEETAVPETTLCF